MSTTLYCLIMLLPQATTVEVEDLIRQLDADKFAERRAAAQRLTEMGPDAFDRLVESAQASSAEVQSRSLDILENHFRNGEASTREAAKIALEKLAKSETQAGRKAQQMLNPTPSANLAQPRQIRIMAPQIAQAQAIQIRMARGMPIQRRIQFSDGTKSVKIEINNQKIKMEITEKKDGKSVTKKIEAKDEADLKKNHPDAYKLFQKHAGAAGARAQIRVPGARPLPAGPAAGAAKQRIIDALKQSEKRLKDQVEKAKKDLEGEELERALESLERRRKSLESIRDRYGDDKEAKAKKEAKAEAETS